MSRRPARDVIADAIPPDIGFDTRRNPKAEQARIDRARRAADRVIDDLAAEGYVIAAAESVTAGAARP